MKLNDSPPLTFGSLFAGIGGIDLGLERAGMRCAWQVEIDEYCQKVLTKHWPDVPKYRDVRSVGAHNLPAVDLLAGGFPCQDISASGPRTGIDGERSGLWREFARIIGELRPRFVLVENVADLIYRGVECVLGDLARLRYDAEWEVIPACAFGASHTRERLFIVAYTEPTERGPLSTTRCRMAHTHNRIQQWQKGSGGTPFGHPAMDRRTWTSEPAVGRVADGVPDRFHRLSGLGNAVVPQVAEFIGRLIVEYDTRNA